MADSPVDFTEPLRGTSEEARFPLGLLVALLVVCALTLIHPAAGRTSWFLEVSPGLVMVLGLAVVFPRFPMSRVIYACVFVHVLILIYGGYYTYALTPLGNWAKDTFHLARNHYDRIGHLALGVFPAFIVREVLLRRTPLRPGAWLSFLVVAVVLAVGAFWEFIEWWVALLSSDDVGTAFLGTQGDPWDTQWDMFLAMVGAIVNVLFLSGIHRRSMVALYTRLGGAGREASAARATDVATKAGAS